MTSRNWLIATIFIFLTICAWVVFGILHTLVNTEIPAETLKLTEPLDPQFNISVLEP